MNGGSSWHVIASEVANREPMTGPCPGRQRGDAAPRDGRQRGSSADEGDSTFSIIPSTKPPETGFAVCSTEQPQEPRRRAAHGGSGRARAGVLPGRGGPPPTARPGLHRLGAESGGPLMVFALPGCSGAGTDGATLSVRRPRSRRAPALGKVYENVGAAGTTSNRWTSRCRPRRPPDPEECRLYPLALESDGLWQREGVALLDFEDGSGSCNTGARQVRTEVVADAPNFGDYSGGEFKIGVPATLNHMNVEWTEPPLHVPSMWWSWKMATSSSASTCARGGTGLTLPRRRGGLRGNAGHRHHLWFRERGPHLPRRFRFRSEPGRLRRRWALREHGLRERRGKRDGSRGGMSSSKEDPECALLLPQLGVGAEPGAVRRPGRIHPHRVVGARV